MGDAGDAGDAKRPLSSRASAASRGICTCARECRSAGISQAERRGGADTGPGPAEEEQHGTQTTSESTCFPRPLVSIPPPRLASAHCP